MAIIPQLIVLIVLIILLPLLQIFLSKRKTKWPGLILPSITLLNSLLMVLNVAVSPDSAVGTNLIIIITVFLLNNIPTAILLGIYFVCRAKMRARAQLEKMNIQDLE